MTVVILTACPSGLRGDMTRWLLEIAPGVFIGHVSARVRERLWARIMALFREGRAIMVYSAQNEQHLEFKVHQPDWAPVDNDGLQLIRRPLGTEESTLIGPPKKGWSNASKYHRGRKYGNT